MPMTAIRRSSAPIVPPPILKRQSGSALGQGARIGREDELDELVEHEADADRRQQRRDVRLALQRPQAEALDAEAEQRADGDDDDDRQRQRRAEMGHRQAADIGAHDIDRAVGEVDQLATPKISARPTASNA